MKLFEEELLEVRKIINSHINKNLKIEDVSDLMDIINNNLDLENDKYKKIYNILNYYIKYEGSLDKKNKNDILLDIEDLKEIELKVFTKTNITMSIILLIIMIFSSIVTNSIFFLIFIANAIIWAYLSKYMGLKKGIDNGYIRGYFLGIIGFIVVCVLPSEAKVDVSVNTNNNSNNKYEYLEKLQKLKESGAITDIEFEVEKQKLLR